MTESVIPPLSLSLLSSSSLFFHSWRNAVLCLCISCCRLKSIVVANWGRERRQTFHHSPTPNHSVHHQHPRAPFSSSSPTLRLLSSSSLLLLLLYIQPLISPSHPDCDDDLIIVSRQIEVKLSLSIYLCFLIAHALSTSSHQPSLYLSI